MESTTEIIHTDDICTVIRSGSLNDYVVLDNQQNELGKITFQNGSPTVGINGATLEAVIATCIYRLDKFNQNQFKCEYNDIALDGLKSALFALNTRKDDRKARNVYDTEKS